MTESRNTREVYSAGSVPEAQAVASELASAGIPARVVEDQLSDTIGYLFINPKIWVFADDYDQARSVVDRFLNSKRKSREAPPGAGR